MGVFSKINPFTFGRKFKVCQNALFAARNFSMMSENERDLIRSIVCDIYENGTRKKITYDGLVKNISTIGLYYFYSLAMGELGISPGIRNEMWFNVHHPIRESIGADELFPFIKNSLENKYFAYFPDLMGEDPFPPFPKPNHTEKLSIQNNNQPSSTTNKKSSLTAEAQQMVDHFKKLQTKDNLVNDVSCPSCQKIGFSVGTKCSQCGFLAEDEYDLIDKFEEKTHSNKTNNFSSPASNKKNDLSAEAEEMVDYFKNLHKKYTSDDSTSSNETIKDKPQNQKTNSIKSIPTSTSVISASFSEYFDLIDSSGRLIADIGVMLTDDFSMLFKTGDAVPTSRKTTFSTSEDNQDSAEITLAARLENGKVFNIGNYVFSGISHAPKGIPVITVTISIKHRELEISAVDSFGSSNIKIAKM